MAHARPEYMITVAIVGVLLAIGIPALARDSYIVGGLCVGFAAVVAIWALMAIVRSRE